ncbi:MAG: DegQ family serine endoprotease [Gammaproteobacteria bacterium]
MKNEIASFVSAKPPFGKGARALAMGACAAVALSFAVATQSFSDQPISTQILPNFSQLVSNVGPAVVSIISTGKLSATRSQQNPFEDMPEQFKKFFDKRFFEQQPNPGPEMRPQGQGSGFIISPDGYVLTNTHVVADADEVLVRLTDRREFKAKVIGSDERADVALLKIDGSGLPTVSLGDSGSLKVGDWVLAIGSPFGFDYSATQGIVSAVGRSLPDGTYVPFIQTDAAVNPGNSGGPLFDLSGKVVGINSQIFSRSGGYMGLSFAIPINVAKNVADQLKAQGYVSRGWLGVMIQDLNQDLAKSFGMDKPHGALVSQVTPDSPAAKAGFKSGDVIVSFDGKPIDRSNDLPVLVGSTAVGASAKVEVVRDGKPETLNVTIGKLEEAPVQQAKAETGDGKLGVAVSELSEQQRAEMKVGHGVLVNQVAADSAAAKAGIQAGDVILSFNRHEVKTPGQLAELVKQAPKDKPSVALVMRDKGTLFLPVQL